jgi:hypothetical protein
MSTSSGVRVGEWESAALLGCAQESSSSDSSSNKSSLCIKGCVQEMVMRGGTVVVSKDNTHECDRVYCLYVVLQFPTLNVHDEEMLVSE